MKRQPYFVETRYRDPDQVNGDVCYLIHFEPAYKQARHYLGTTNNLQRRLREHLTGAGARIVEVATLAGCRCQLVRIWRGGRGIERELKSKRRAPDFCPICNPKTPRRIKR